MDIHIKSCVEGARQAEGTVVIIDVFRASNTIITLLGQGADSIIAVDTLEKAYALKKQNPDHLLFGERNGLPPAGFDYGNSPAETATLNLSGKKIILTTSNGTQGIVNASRAQEILVGSFANAAALTRYISTKQPSVVTLVAMGFEDATPAEEDERCAHYLKELFQGRKPDFSPVKQALLHCAYAEKLRGLHQDADLAFCLMSDTYTVIPRVIQMRPYPMLKNADRTSS